MAPANQPENSPLGTLDLHTADLAGINVLPGGSDEPPQVELQLRAQQPVTVQGTIDNSDVKRVLLYILHNSQRFDPDVRLSAVDLLRAIWVQVLGNAFSRDAREELYLSLLGNSQLFGDIWTEI